MKRQNLAGQKFNQLTAIKFIRFKNKRSIWLFECDCGTKKELIASLVKIGNTKSCGCFQRNKIILNNKNNKFNYKHGLSKTRIYDIWHHMIDRCYNIKNKNYKNYGGRKITVCKEWMSIQNFINWSNKNGYQNNLTIDRIDNNGNYTPSNCRWVTLKAQSRNKSTNKIVIAFNEAKSLIEWSEDKRCKVSYKTLQDRISKNISPELALTVLNFKKCIILK